MKKKIVLAILLIISSCKNDKIYNMETEIDKKMFYVVNTSIPLVKRGQIIVNDMVCYTESNDRMSLLIHLNYYLIPNQKQRVSFEIKAQYNENWDNDKFTVGAVSGINEYFDLARFIKINGETADDKTHFFPRPKLDLDEDKRLNYYKFDWEFELLEPLNFEMKGWSDGQDLRKLDKEYLEKLVYSKFKYFRDLLNEGKAEEFVKELDVSVSDYFASKYYDKEYEQEYKNNLIEAYSMLKGFVLPLEGCVMRIMGDGKVVALERTDEHLGHGALLAIDKGEGNMIYKTYVMLYLPEGSSELKVIRHVSTMEMYEYRPEDIEE